MAKYKVYGVMTASCFLGEYEAASAQEARTKAENDPKGNWWHRLGHQCSGEVELGEIYETQAEIVI